ncbi:SUMO-1 activating enzyme subunit 2 [Cryptosporidium ryanae]|uniref:SUMO-1 activating enzyme subunit 2 n=1 Tax=Cryptosporidium ryanae TaxID=515981 RepID=UPI003519F5EF|nr:SUMO-1 activating enzyme subunit 2 [Cryptosporidium ryanae]
MKEQTIVKKILGEILTEKIQSVRILVVGAGGIGCELIKNLVLCGSRYITIIDMDGVDISNLNRQFFFRRKHVGMSKSIVIAQEATSLLKRRDKYNTQNFDIKGIVGNIINFGTDFFKKFSLVLNALDNVSSRSYVNKICVASNIELIDAGSAGFSGQVHPIIPRISRCYECTPPPVQKSFPICTIRLTPDKPQHCIAWSKNLFEIMFGTDENSEENSDNILSDIANKIKIDFATLNNKEDTIRDIIIDEYIKNTFNFLFSTEINLLLNNKFFENSDIRPPIPISWDESQNQGQDESNKTVSSNKTNSDHNILSIKEIANIFYKSTYELINKKKAVFTPLVFDKDNKIMMDFVFSASNIRSHNFNIKYLSRWDCQSIAGSIIPAIASTNAIVAGVQVVQLLVLLKSKLNIIIDKLKSDEKCENLALNYTKFVWIRNIPIGKFLICPESLDKSNPTCLACSQKIFKVIISSFENWSLDQFVTNLICKHLKLLEPFIELDGKCIWDPDLICEDQYKEKSQRKLSEWKFYNGCIITITDYSEGEFQCDVIVESNGGIGDNISENILFNEFNNEKFVLEIKMQKSILENNDTSILNYSSEEDIPVEVCVHDELLNTSIKRKEIENDSLDCDSKKIKIK